MGTFISAVSPELAHPLPALIADPLVLVNVGTGRVTRVPVGVYEGKAETGPPVLRLAGGHAKLATADAGILPAPAPPVCAGVSGGVQGLVFPQVPMASRGSVGIQPFSRPS